MKKIVGSFALLSLLTMTGFSAQAETAQAGSVQAESAQPESSQAEGEGTHINITGLYLGGGLGFNQAGSGAQGIQLFGGYKFNFKINEDITTAVELGYMDTGDFDGTNDNVAGFWIAAVESVPLSSKADMLFRLGYDFGDDDGFLLGTGMQYKFDTSLALRMEYIARQNITSLQANVVFNF